MAEVGAVKWMDGWMDGMRIVKYRVKNFGCKEQKKGSEKRWLTVGYWVAILECR